MPKRTNLLRETVLGTVFNYCPNDDSILIVVEHGMYKSASPDDTSLVTAPYRILQCQQCKYTLTQYDRATLPLESGKNIGHEIPFDV